MNNGHPAHNGSGGILVVDDSEFLRDRMRDALERLGYLVVGEATDGDEAVQAYQDLKPALVTMDVVMPKVDGISAVRSIRALDPNAR